MSDVIQSKWQKSRYVTKRIFITGCLVLDTPTHFGNGDSEGLTDISLLRDSLTGRPLLTGSSIAGALRADVHEREMGYGKPEGRHGGSQAEYLFGYVGTESVPETAQIEPREITVESWLMVDDAIGTFAPSPFEIRDGVQIKRDTRTAEDQFKYDIELLAAGTTFPLHFELWLEGSHEEQNKRIRWLASALHNLEIGNVRLGMRKRRGFGKCRVAGWRVETFDMSNRQDVIDWLQYEVPETCEADERYQPNILQLMNCSAASGRSIKTKIGIFLAASCGEFNPIFELKTTLPEVDKRQSLTLEATFQLKHSLLIRAELAEGDAPDTLHLRNAANEPIVSGTSIAGAMRARAYRIINTLANEVRAKTLLNSMFGLRLTGEEKKALDDKARQPTGSRITVDETKIQHPLSQWVQSRVKIDRFTGGAYPQALFSQQPIFAKSDKPTIVQINVNHRKCVNCPFEAEVGLLLLVLKDLWTEDLPLGGESSIGRGRLSGQTARLEIDNKVWSFEAQNGRLHFTQGQPNELDRYVTNLHTYLKSAT